ncbi:MAG: ATP-binding protein [Spirochaetes bacterium]|nr:ATP-binding protein [Spirochaetota bacterium]MBN2771556.1 ATP-binding protein [Spirochaetota bacterium]
MDNNLFLQKKIKRDLDELDSFRESFLYYLTENGIEEETASHFELCAYEVIANIIEHDSAIPGFCEDIQVTFSAENNYGQVILNYSGPEFDLTKRPLPDISAHFQEGLKRGLGIYIIHKLMDEIWYTHNEGENSLTMKKSIPDNSRIKSGQIL